MKSIRMGKAELRLWARELRAERDRADAELKHVEGLLALKDGAPRKRASPGDTPEPPEPGQSLIDAVEAALSSTWRTAPVILGEIQAKFPKAKTSTVSTALARLVDDKHLAERKGPKKQFEFRRAEVKP